MKFTYKITCALLVMGAALTPVKGAFAQDENDVLKSINEKKQAVEAEKKKLDATKFDVLPSENPMVQAVLKMAVEPTQDELTDKYTKLVELRAVITKSAADINNALDEIKKVGKDKLSAYEYCTALKKSGDQISNAKNQMVGKVGLFPTLKKEVETTAATFEKAANHLVVGINSTCEKPDEYYSDPSVRFDDKETFALRAATTPHKDAVLAKLDPRILKIEESLADPYRHIKKAMNGEKPSPANKKGKMAHPYYAGHNELFTPAPKVEEAPVSKDPAPVSSGEYTAPAQSSGGLPKVSVDGDGYPMPGSEISAK